MDIPFFFVVPVMFKLCSQHHITYNSVSRSMSREREMEKKDMDTPPGRSKEKKEEKDRKERKRVSTHRTLVLHSSSSHCCLLSAGLNICSHCVAFRTTLSTTARWAWKPSGRRTRTEPVRQLPVTAVDLGAAHAANPAPPVSPDSFKNSKSSSPSCDSPLSVEKEKSKRSKSSSKEKAESVKPERASSAAKKVILWACSESLAHFQVH